MGMVAIATVGTFASMTLALGLLLAFTPYLMRRTECFAVTVPAAAQADRRLVALKKRYAKTMLVVTAVCTAASAIAGVLVIQGSECPGTATTAASVVLECAAVIVPVVLSFALMLRNRSAVRRIKRAEGWTAAGRQTVATIAEADVPGALPFAWSLLHVPVILGTLALGLALYPAMPDMLPMHADFAGNVTSWEPKTLVTVLGFPLLLELFLAACSAFSHWMILRSKRPANPAAPATSALAYGLFARAQSVFLLGSGVLVSGSIGVLFLLSSAGFVGLGQAGIVIVVVCLVILTGSVALSFIYGQAGSRVFKRMQREDVLLDDEDEHWKLGIFYFNPSDASVFLPERFGIGWTMNFARPAAWAVILGVVAVTAVFIGALSLLF